MAKKRYSNNRRNTKKSSLLNETQIRRFMGLAGLQPLKEMYGKKMEEDEMNEGIYEEEEEGEMEMDADAPAPAPVEEPEAELEAGEGETKEISQDMVDDAAEALASLQGLVTALGGEDAPEDDMAMDDEPELGGEEMDMGDEEEEAEEAEEVIQEALKGVNLKLSENEIVQEVARRVAKRILKAKQAQSRLDEALGTKKPARRQRKK